MAIPQTALVIVEYDPDELTLGESHTLFGDTYAVDDFRQFLLDHVDHKKSWTRKEIDAIKRKELDVVRKQLFDALIDMKSPPKDGESDAPPLVAGA
ncbi:MAG: hypothetical protein V1899_03040 [Planctomycetota bacterium]